MTKPKKFTYQIQYNDSNYRIVDWTKKEYSQVGEGLVKQAAAVVLDEGAFVLHDIRAIVLLPEIEETDEKKEHPDDTHLSEWGFTEPEVQAWLKQQGIDVVNGGGKDK